MGHWCTLIQKGTGIGFAFCLADESRHRLQHLNSSYSQNDASDMLAVTVLKVPESTLSDTKCCSCSGHCHVPQGASVSAGLSDHALCFCLTSVKSRSWGHFYQREAMNSFHSSLPLPARMMGKAQHTTQQLTMRAVVQGHNVCLGEGQLLNKFPTGWISLWKLFHIAQKE